MGKNYGKQFIINSIVLNENFIKIFQIYYESKQKRLISK